MEKEIYLPTMQIYKTKDIFTLCFGKCSINVNKEYKDFLLNSIITRATKLFEIQNYSTQLQYDALIYYVVTHELITKELKNYGVYSIEFIDLQENKSKKYIYIN